MLYLLVDVFMNTCKISTKIHSHTWVGKERMLYIRGDNSPVKFELLLLFWGHLCPQAGNK